MKNFITLAITFMAMTQTAFAANLVDKIKKENPQMTAYQVLEKAFNSAADPISMADFATNLQIRTGNFMPWKIVYPFLKKDSNIYSSSEAALAVFQWTLPGAESRGPLFPKQPDTIVKRLLMCRDQDQSIEITKMASCSEDRSYELAQQNQPALFVEGGYQEKIYPNQIATTIKYYSTSVFMMTIRKSGNLIFIRADDSRDGKTSVEYSYGWKVQKP